MISVRVRRYDRSAAEGDRVRRRWQAGAEGRQAAHDGHDIEILAQGVTSPLVVLINGHRGRGTGETRSRTPQRREPLGRNALYNGVPAGDRTGRGWAQKPSEGKHKLLTLSEPSAR